MLRFLFSRRHHLSSLVRPHRWAIPIIVLLGLVSFALEGAGIGLLIPLVQTVVVSGYADSHSGSIADLIESYFNWPFEDHRAAFLSLIIFLLVVAKNVVVIANQALMLRIDRKLNHEIRTALFAKVTTAPYELMTQQKPGRILNVIDREAWQTSDAIRNAFYMTVSLSALVIFGLLLVKLSWRLSLFVLLGFVLLRLLVERLTKTLSALSRENVEVNAMLTECLTNAFGGLRIVRIFGQENREQSRYGMKSEAVEQNVFAIYLYTALISPLLEIGHVAFFLTVLFVAWRAGLELPVLATFLVLLYRTQPHLRTFEECRAKIIALRGAVAEVEWLLSQPEPPPVERGFRFVGMGKEIRFEQVGFRFEARSGGAPALENVTFRVPKGQITAIVGVSGSGKSTLINLLCRLYAPSAGNIWVDDQRLADIDIGAWRRQIAVTGQDAELFNGTILENITYGRPDARHDEVEAAARKSEAHEFIAALPNGYDTIVGARGTSLSGGQRQRIALARALLCDPEILILDEATNAVDPTAEANIMRTVSGLAGQMTIIVIAHRLSAITCADQIVVLRDGQVVEIRAKADIALLRNAELPLSGCFVQQCDGAERD
jgi:subfamily B ATP-binding cassette protein MsbA